MTAPLFGISVSSTLIGFVAVIVYLAVLLALGWESHQKYGTGYYWVGACLAGAIGEYFNYRYWAILRESESTGYPLWAFIISSAFLPLIGLWSFLIYFAIMQRLEKRYRAGTRLEKKVFSAEQAATGTGRFRDMLKGWEGDMRLDALIVEERFDEAEDLLEGIIITSNQERDSNKARHYEQYHKVIMTERLFHQQSKEFHGESVDEKSKTGQRAPKEFDSKQAAGEIKQEDLPEGWKLSE